MTKRKKYKIRRNAAKIDFSMSKAGDKYIGTVEIPKPDVYDADVWEIVKRGRVFLIGTATNSGLLSEYYFKMEPGESEQKALEEINADLEVLATDGPSYMSRVTKIPKKISANRRRGLRRNQTPLERLRYHVSGAIERGEKQAIAGIPTTRIPTDYEYRMREAQLFRKDIQDVEKASLADRKEAAMHWLFDLKNNPLMVAERVLWLFQGAYGKGSYDAACAVLKSRMNQVAWAAITIAALEWKCPARFATMAWKKLNPVEQRKVNGLIKMKIEEFKKDGSCG